ncbi:MAG TPA: MFS transporter [Faecalibacter sp.]
MQNTSSNKLWNRNFFNVCFSSFFIFTNFYLLAATMPIYVKRDLSGSATHISLIISLYILGTVLLRPFSGRWADRFGKRKMSIAFLLLFIGCNLAYLGTDAIVPLLIVRFINGFGFAVTTTSTAALAMDWIPKSRKGEGIGYFSLFMSLAMVIGPALGLFLTNNFEYQVVLRFALGFAILALVFSFFTSEISTQLEKSQQPTVYTGWDKYIERKSLPFSFAGFLLALAYSSLLSYVALYTIELGYPQASMFFFIVLAFLIIIPRPYVGKLFDRKGANALVYPGSIILVIGLIGLALSFNLWTILISAGIIGLGYGAIFPAYQTLSVSAASPQRAGTASATFFLLYDIGIGIGSFVLGIIASIIGYSNMYLTASGIAIISLMTYIIINKKMYRKKNEVK